MFRKYAVNVSQKMANYSISYELGKPNKLGLSQLYLRLLLDRKKILIKQSYKIHSKISKEEKFLIDKLCLDAQKKIISFVNAGGEISPINLKNIFAENIASANTIVDYLDAIEDRLKSRFSENRVKGYGTLRNKIAQITPNATFLDISMVFLEKFESSLKKQKRNVKTEIINGEKKVQYTNLSHNYVAQLMSVFVAVLNRAHKDGIIEKEKFVDYNPQPEKYDIPEYLTETEINKLYQLSDIIDDPNKQICAKYFLLGCHTGLRLMDLINFDKKRVLDERIALRADKNGRIISMPIYPRLRELIEFVITHPFPISEQKFRENIKKLCKLIGVKDRNIKIHTARHSFAMLLMGKGFTSDEVAEYLGDSPEVARVYARISAKLLDTKLMDAMNNIGK